MSADDLERDQPASPLAEPPSKATHPLPLAGQPRVTPPICRWLRSKVAGQHGDPAALERLRGEPSAIFWCLLTMGPAGPDDGLAHIDLCDQARTCVEST